MITDNAGIHWWQENVTGKLNNITDTMPADPEIKIPKSAVKIQIGFLNSLKMDMTGIVKAVNWSRMMNQQIKTDGRQIPWICPLAEFRIKSWHMQKSDMWIVCKNQGRGNRFMGDSPADKILNAEILSVISQRKPSEKKRKMVMHEFWFWTI